MKPPKQIDLNSEEFNALQKRIANRSLEEKDYEIINGMAETIRFLSFVVEEKKFSIGRLLKRLFGSQSEKSKKILKEDKEKKDKKENSANKDSGAPEGAPFGEGKQENSSDDTPACENPLEKEDGNSPASSDKKGHGRNGASCYTGADVEFTSHQQLKSGAPCSACPKGKVYPLREPGVVVRVVGRAPLQATVYQYERLRCSLCGKIFSAKLPKQAGEGKYDPSASVMIALLKYGSGFPFYRLKGLQENLGQPLPASTQWEKAEELADKIYPAHNELIRQGAQGEILHNDDTPMKILDLMKQNEEQDPVRKGLFTTGIISIVNERKIAMFFTGRKHAGENMEALLQQRDKSLPLPIQMCDALSRNIPKNFKVILANCLTHGRRNFADVIYAFPQECSFVIETLGQVYKTDQEAKERNMTPSERLESHQNRSGPLMEKLKEWLKEQFDGKRVEPNSSLGKAISYMVKHWQPLTLFLRMENAPLDNNICEQALKKSILHRKNSLFFKTEHGASIGDIFMTLIHTCNLNTVNPFKYLRALCENSSHVFKDPAQWMPWNYEATEAALA